MKLLLLAISVALVASAHAETVEANSQISAVTVYADRARIMRVAEVAVPSGENVIRFSGLPQDLDESSVQASGSSDARVKILGLEIRDHFSETVIDERVRELERQLVALNDQQKGLDAQKTDLRERKSFLQKVRDGMSLSQSVGDKVPPQGVAGVKPLYEFYTSEMASLSQQLLATDIAIRDLGPKRNVIEEELNRLRGNGAKATKEVLVAVKSDASASGKINLSYNMSSASWQPSYDARADTRTGKIELSSYGVLRQQTGEEWKNVKLSLSTARPNVGARMPELQPWWVQFMSMAPMPVTMAPPLARSNMARGQAQTFGYSEMNVAEEKAAPMKDQAATIDSSGISAVFEIKLPATIPSDGESHKVPIAVQQFDAKLDYVTTPKLSDSVYLKTRVTNTSAAPLLGGDVNLFRDGDFVGKSHVNFIAAGADFDFFLGVDDAVKVTRKMVVDKSAEGGVFQKRKSLVRKIETKINNFKTQKIALTVVDQLPVSKDAPINVEDVKFNEAPKTQDKETGKLTWEFSLDPKQEKVLTEEFTVTWPADKQVSGL